MGLYCYPPQPLDRKVVRQLEDQILIELLLQDPDRGIEAAIRQYGGLCKGIIVRILGEGGDAEECLADTFAALWRHAQQWKAGEGSLKSYLAAIARNTAISRRRKLRRCPPFIPAEEAALGELTGDSFHEALERRELLRDAMLELDRTDRELLIRRYFYGETVQEAAARLGLTAKYAENRLYKGRQQLKKILLQRGVII